MLCHTKFYFQISLAFFTLKTALLFRVLPVSSCFIAISLHSFNSFFFQQTLLIQYLYILKFNEEEILHYWPKIHVMFTIFFYLKKKRYHCPIYFNCTY